MEFLSSYDVRGRRNGHVTTAGTVERVCYMCPTGAQGFSPAAGHRTAETLQMNIFSKFPFPEEEQEVIFKLIQASWAEI